MSCCVCVWVILAVGASFCMMAASVWVCVSASRSVSCVLCIEKVCVRASEWREPPLLLGGQVPSATWWCVVCCVVFVVLCARPGRQLQNLCKLNRPWHVCPYLCLELRVHVPPACMLLLLVMTSSCLPPKLVAEHSCAVLTHAAAASTRGARQGRMFAGQHSCPECRQLPSRPGLGCLCVTEPLLQGGATVCSRSTCLYTSVTLLREEGRGIAAPCTRGQGRCCGHQCWTAACLRQLL